MTITTGLSGNEIYCLAKNGYRPGNIVVGNSVHSLGLLGTLGSGFKTLLGGELDQVTSLIEAGRKTALQRMLEEAQSQNACGITGVTSELVFHFGNIEFLSIGSAIHADNPDNKIFSTSADGQELFAQLDAGFKPICFAFGNVAYSIGVGRGFIGGIKTFMRGEIREYTKIFNHTRHAALERIVKNAKENNANAVLGIKTSILPLMGMSEMIMLGTASFHPDLPSDDVITSDLTNIEMWNLASLGYVPIKLVLGTSIYSLGFVGSITSALKGFVRGEINELTRMIYDARENAIGSINAEAKTLGADEVVGVKTYVYQLGNGLIEFLAIGTAVKKNSDVKLSSSQLPPQAIIVDKNTFFDTTSHGFKIGTKNISPLTFVSRTITILILIIFFIVLYHH